MEPSEDIRVHLLTKEEITELLLTDLSIEGVMQAPVWRLITVNYGCKST